jgi:hypothetical protein
MIKYKTLVRYYDRIVVRMLFYLFYLCVCWYIIKIYDEHLRFILLVRVKFNFTFVKYIFPVVIQCEIYANCIIFSVLEAR